MIMFEKSAKAVVCREVELLNSIKQLQAENKRLEAEKQVLMKLSHRPEKEINKILDQALKD